MSSDFSVKIKKAQSWAHIKVFEAFEAVGTSETIDNDSINPYLGNPGIVNDFDQTLLNILINSNDVDKVQALLNKGANPNKPSIWRKTGRKVYALQEALNRGSIQMINMLIAAGALFDYCSPSDLFCDCVIGGQSYECLKYLFDNGILNRNHIGQSQIRTAFARLVASRFNKGHEEMIEICRFLISLNKDFLKYTVEPFLTFEKGIKEYRINF